ncbi:NAD(P)-dependent alcohol dehydrogenase [Bifidobacterium aquikefiricola]|uniref:alcohol dehydrogenase (NADP(+)) n=1 Tax=Bifidobacterium aquikefiricola TaxID=3059038 RepID=A0AB39U9A4_9BIFI
MPYASKSLIVQAPGEQFKQGSIDRRDVGSDDVRIRIACCGICHSDLHQAHGDWPDTIFPMVPGHEIVGVIEEMGADVPDDFFLGQRVGVGCFVDSCGACRACQQGYEQFCRKGQVSTYNARDYDGEITYGGYSASMTVKARYVIAIPDALDSFDAAPLLCAGVTLFSPLERWQIGQGSNVALIGMGGIGHIGVQLAHSLGARVTVIGRNAAKREDALRFGADRYLSIEEMHADDSLLASFGMILNTTAGVNDLEWYLSLLDVNGVYVPLGLGDANLSFSPPSLFWNNRTVAGSLIGGIAANQRSIDYCAANDVRPEIEVVKATPEGLNAAYERLAKSDVRYRFVLDMTPLQ